MSVYIGKYPVVIRLLSSVYFAHYQVFQNRVAQYIKYIEFGNLEKSAIAKVFNGKLPNWLFEGESLRPRKRQKSLFGKLAAA